MSGEDGGLDEGPGTRGGKDAVIVRLFLNISVTQMSFRSRRIECNSRLFSWIKLIELKMLRNHEILNISLLIIFPSGLPERETSKKDRPTVKLSGSSKFANITQG